MLCNGLHGNVWCVVFGDVLIQFVPPPVSGASGAGKSFNADQLLVKMFQTAHKTDWLQDLSGASDFIHPPNNPPSNL